MKKIELTKDTKWVIDTVHSRIGFKVKHLMIANVRGIFKKFDASIYTEGDDFTSAEIDFWLDPASIDTGDEKRDIHLMSADFFDVQTHKQITFTSSTMGEPDSEGCHELWGELTIKGITKNIKLKAQFGGILNDPWGNEKAGFTVTGKINRNDWELTWNTVLEKGGFMVSEEVVISCEVELTNVSPKDLKMELNTTGIKNIL